MVYKMAVVSPYGYEIFAMPLDGSMAPSVTLMASVTLADQTPDDGIFGVPFQDGRPVKPESMPTHVQWDNDDYYIPDFHEAGCITVSSHVKDIIERFEPATHQFLPVRYLSQRMEPKVDRWFLIVCNRIDSLDDARTTFVKKTYHVARDDRTMHAWLPVVDFLIQGKFDEIPPHLSRDTDSKYIFSRSKIAGRRLWRDKYMMGDKGPYMSDELTAALVAAEVTGLRPLPQDTV